MHSSTVIGLSKQTKFTYTETTNHIYTPVESGSNSNGAFGLWYLWKPRMQASTTYYIEHAISQQKHKDNTLYWQKVTIQSVIITSHSREQCDVSQWSHTAKSNTIVENFSKLSLAHESFPAK